MTLLTQWFTRLHLRSQWFSRIRSGHIDVRDDKAFVRWLESDPANEERYEAAELAWGLSLELKDRPKLAQLLEETQRDLEARGASPRNPRPSRWAIAGTLAVLVAAAAVVVLQYRVATADYGTKVGEMRIVKLDDGSTLSLNTATQVHVRYSRRWRSIELLSGEALFAVHPDADRPFTVLALGGVTTAVGTEFAVQVHGTSAAVTVLEGKVTVRPLAPIPTSQSRQISIGQAVDYGPGGAMGETHDADADRIRAWQAHRILFSDKPLAEAIEEYNRYETRPIILAAPELADRHVHGIFRVGDQEAFIHALERALPLRAKRMDDAVTLVPK